eukprot:3138659-Prymnesium_polylepis.1
MSIMRSLLNCDVSCHPHARVQSSRQAGRGPWSVRSMRGVPWEFHDARDRGHGTPRAGPRESGRPRPRPYPTYPPGRARAAATPLAGRVSRADRDGSET